MDRLNARLIWLTAVVASTVPIGSALAAGTDQDARNAREHEMLHRAQEALQEAQHQNADLLKAKSDAEAKLKLASDQLAQTATSRNSAEARSAALQSELQKAGSSKTDLSNRLDVAVAQLASLKAKQESTQEQLTRKESELSQVTGQLSTSKVQIQTCEAKNLKLYEYGQTVLQQYQHKGVWGALLQKEPVTGIKQVEIENFAQDYQDKLDAQKLKTPPQ